MKKLVYLVLITCMLLPSIVAQDKTSEEEQQKAWMEYASPGVHHQHLLQMVGSWKAVSKYWKAPGAKAIVGSAEAEVKSILGGRYTMMEYKANWMGMPFQGIGISGYDNLKKVYQDIWLDNMGTGIYQASGTCDQDGKIFTYYGKMIDPVTKKTLKTKNVAKIINKDKFIFTMYCVSPEGDFKMMENIYTRK